MARSRGPRVVRGEEPNRVLGFPLRSGPDGRRGDSGRPTMATTSAQAPRGTLNRLQAEGTAPGHGAEPQRVLGIPLTWLTALGRKRSG